MTDSDRQQLDELDREIDDARKQAEDHGTITPEDGPDPTYKAGAGGPVGLPIDEDQDEES